MQISNDLLKKVDYFETVFNFKNSYIVLYFKEKNIFGFRKKLKLKYPNRLTYLTWDTTRATQSQSFVYDVNKLRKYLDNRVG